MRSTWSVKWAILGLVFVALGCTRKVSDNASIRLSFGGSGSSAQQKSNSVKSYAAGSVNVIVINVTGPGISPPIFYQWQGSHNSSVASVPPSTIDLTVPKGDGRLIQALVVMNPPEGESGSIFLYGDSVASFSGDTTEVAITTLPLGNASAGDAQIAGRYLATPTMGPTGKINVYYQIPGKPKMLVDNHSEMFAGWFRVFGIEGGTLEYMLSDGSSLFGGPIAVDSPQLLTTGADSSRTLRMVTPAHYRKYGSGGAISMEGAGHSVYGFFGPGSSGKQICYKSTVGTVPYAYSDAAGTTELNWDPVTASPASDDVFIEVVNGVRGGVGTGTTDASTMCSMGGLTRYSDFISVNEKQATSHDQVLGFKGPFQVQTNNNGGSLLSTSVASNTLTVSWKFLPGVQASAGSGIAGVDIFGRVEVAGAGNNENYRADDGVNCGGIESYGFTFFGNQPSNSDPTVLPMSATISSIPADFSTAFASGLTTVVVCPYSMDAQGKHYFSSAAIAYPNSGGGGGGLPMATSLEIVGPQSPNAVTLVTNTCTPIHLLGRNGGQLARFPMGQVVNLSPDAGLTLWDDPGCYMHAVAGSITVSSSDRELYAKVSDVANHTLTATAPGIAIVGPLNFTSIASPTPVPFLVVQAPTSITAFACYEFHYQGWNDYLSANKVIVALPSYPNFTFPSTDLLFFSDMNGPCMGNPISSISIGSMAAESKGYFMYTGTGTTTNIQPVSASGFTGAYDGVTNIAVSQPGVMTGLDLTISPNLTEGVCSTVQISRVDAMGRPTADANSYTINLTTDRGSFFSDYACGGGVSSATLTPFNPSVTVYYRATSSGAANVAATIPAVTPTASKAITIDPAQADHFLVAFPGETFNGSAIVGTPLPVGNNQPVTAMVYAMKYDSTLDAGYNVPMVNLYGTNFSVPSAGGVMFVNGVASINVTAWPGVNYGSINGMATTLNGSVTWYSSGLTLVPLATKYSIYGNNLMALNPGACQVVMIVPEDADGAAMPSSPSVSVLLTVTGGTMYTDAACTNAVGASFNATQGVPYYIFYFKGTASSGGTISTSPGSASVATSTSAGGSVSTPTNWQLLGRLDGSGGTTANRCNPYAVYLSDSAGLSVTGTSNGVLHVQMGSIAGTTGAFYSTPDCSTGLLDVPSNNYVSFPTNSLAVVYASGPATPGNIQSMNVTGTPYTSTSPQLTAH